MKKFCLSLLLVCLLPVSALAQELMVFAAISLTESFNELKAIYEKEHPGIEVVLNLGASGSLYRQIEQGAPADVFASANQKWMNVAGEKGYILSDTRADFAHNNLVLAVPQGNPAQVSGIEDLNLDKVQRICLGNPQYVPAGQYTQAALEKRGMWDSLAPKLLPTETVRQALDYLRRGEVDCGFVYQTDAKSAEDSVEIIAKIELEQPVSYPVAVVKDSKQLQHAKQFVELLLSEQGKEILEKYGFSRP